MRVAVVGSRRSWWRDPEKAKKYIWETLDRLLEPFGKDVCVVSGGQTGVDAWALEYAWRKGLYMKIFYPKGDEPIHFYHRNLRIVENSDIIYAFMPKGRPSKGTSMIVELAKKYGKKVEVFEVED